jgi:hypothetical protein
MAVTQLDQCFNGWALYANPLSITLHCASLCFFSFSGFAMVGHPFLHFAGHHLGPIPAQGLLHGFE